MLRVFHVALAALAVTWGATELHPFDGKTLTGWAGDMSFWSAEDGSIVGRSTNQHPLTQSTYLVWQGDMPRDFDLRCKVRLSGADANSGIHYRSHPVQGQADLAGFQADLDSKDAYTGALYEGLGRSLMSARGEQVEWTPSGKRVLANFAPAAVLRKAIKHEGWNEYRILAEGTRVRHYINGVLMTDVTDGDASRFRGDGMIGFQLHQGAPMEVRFKDIVVQPIQTAPGPEAIAVPSDFKVELLASAQPGQGSWVCLTFDPKGNVIVSPQSGELMRIVLGDGAATVESAGAEAGDAQGLCFVGNDLYVNGRVRNGPTALWRLRDADGDGAYESRTQMVKYEGDVGEHGPHAIVKGPDGALYVAIGNHTRLPGLVTPASDTAVGSAVGSPYTNFAEDSVQQRMWDPRGHAVGIYAPGGVVLRLDPATEKATVFAGGFRNAYDHCFNAHGELITYDSDMEWDIGAPWYRAPRVVHVVQGGEYGWRSGSTCWPEFYADSLPPICETDSASPTGMLSGHESAWPEPWKSTIFCGDWTFGRILAVTLTPAGATYTGEWQPWATGRPMPVADMAWGPDGQMYVVTGGRSMQSGLYRISYVGKNSPAATTAADPAVAADPSASAADSAQAQRDYYSSQRMVRRKFESMQRPLSAEELKAALPFLLAGLDSADQFIRFASRTALEHQPIAAWMDELVALESLQARAAGMLAVARLGDRSARQVASGIVGECVGAMDEGEVTRVDAIAALRALEIAIAREPQLRDADTTQLLGILCVMVSSASDQLLIEDPLVWEAMETACALGVPAAVPVAVDRMLRAPDRAAAMRYATMLRTVKEGWTDELRAQYWKWLDAADDREGGFSLRGFIEQIKRDALANVGRPKGSAAQTASDNAAPSSAPAVPAIPAAPIATSATRHDWTASELAVDPAYQADLARGARIFREATCILCHRFNGQGSSTGPDLTGVGGRFTRDDLVRAILQPSETVSDQYRDSAIETKDGDFIVGRIVSDSADAIEVRTNPLTEDRERVAKDRIATVSPIETSSMPSGLVNSRSREEILDLLAYLQSQPARRTR